MKSNPQSQHSTLKIFSEHTEVKFPEVPQQETKTRRKKKDEFKEGRLIYLYRCMVLQTGDFTDHYIGVY